MPQLTVDQALKFAELQMAAEAFIRSGAIFSSEGESLETVLQAGKGHNSVFTRTQAAAFKDHWKALDQRENTGTGFSGTLFECIADDPLTGAKTGERVIALRRTEFIDDHVRDNQGTKRLEIVAFGFAFGQLRDLEERFAELTDTNGYLGHRPNSVVGYSLGGHLATAFNLLHRDSERPQQVVTFNGAGIGQLRQGQTLRDLLDRFTELSRSTDGAAFGLSDHTLLAIFDRTRVAMAAGGTISTADRTQLRYLIDTPDEVQVIDPELRTAARLVDHAVKRVESIVAAREDVAQQRDSQNNSPKAWPLQEIEQSRHEYQMALLTVATGNTSSAGYLKGLEQTFNGGSYSGQFNNQFDVQGDTRPSMTADSQWHHGYQQRTFIEDQPLLRGGVARSVLLESILSLDAKLLVSPYDTKNFGDTHSLVLLVDSLLVQNTLLQFVPAAQRQTAQAAIDRALRQASHSTAGLGGPDLQGRAEGDVLERVTNGLLSLVKGPAQANALRGSLAGNTFHEVGPFQVDGETYAGREDLHAALAVIANSALRQAAGDQVQLVTDPDTLRAAARSDFGAYAALYALSPIGVVGLSSAAVNLLRKPWGELFTEWAQPGQRAITDHWLADRSEFLRRKQWFGTENIDPAPAAMDNTQGSSVPLLPGNMGQTYFEDRAAGYVIAPAGRVGISTHMPRVVFGDMRADTIAGSQVGDALYGGGSADLVRGQDGPDHLEGNTGADTLIGGSGADTLFGGTGDDTYVLTKTDLAERVTDLVGDADGQDQIRIATGLNPDGTPIGDKPLALIGWNPIENQDPNAPKRYTDNAGFTLTVAGRDLWTLSGEALPTEATLRLSSDKTLSLDFGRAGSTLEIKDWSQGKLGIELRDYTAPAAPAQQLGLAQVRDLALLQVAAGIDLFGAVGSGQAALLSRLTSAPTGSGTADRLTPAQAQDLLSRYEVLVQVGNDGSGFSATVFRRKPELDAQGRDISQVDPYVVAFRGNDYEPHRAAGLAKDGGLGAMAEVDSAGFDFGQLDAMQRFWAGLAEGKVMNRAGQLIDVGAASGAASSRNLAIGSGVGAHLAAAFTLLHPGNVSQTVGFDGPGPGGMADGSDGAGGSRPITAAELKAKLDRFVLLMANRSPSNSFTEEIQQAGGAWMQKYLLALEADRPNEAQYSGYYNVLASAGATPFGPGSDTYQAAQNWQNFWDGANIYHRQFYKFIIDWLLRDTVGAGQGQQLDAAWAALTAADNVDAVSGQFKTGAFTYPAQGLDGAAAGSYTSWTLDPDRLDPSALVGGQGHGGQQRSLWVEDTLGIDTPASRTELEQQIHDRGWGTNTASRPVGSPGNLTRLLDSLGSAVQLRAGLRRHQYWSIRRPVSQEFRHRTFRSVLVRGAPQPPAQAPRALM